MKIKDFPTPQKDDADGNIIICRADEAADRARDEKIVAVLSIEHPGVKEGEKGAAPRIEGVAQMILSFWDSEEEVENGPDQRQIAEGIDFVLRHLSRGDVIIHCHAGKARSAAVALGVLALRHPQEDAQQLIARLLAIRPIAAPNILVLAFADAVAQRGGTLVAAVLADNALTAARRDTAEGRARWQERHPEKFPPPKTQKPRH